MESNGRSLQNTDPRSHHKGAVLEGDEISRNENGKVSTYTLLTRVTETKTTENTDTLGHRKDLYESCVDEFHQTDTVVTEDCGQHNNNVIEMESVEQTHADKRCKETSLHKSQDKLHAVNCKDDVNENSESTKNIHDAEGGEFVNKADFGNEGCADDSSLNRDTKDNTLDSMGDLSDHPRSVVLPESSRIPQNPGGEHQQFQSDLIPDLAQAMASDPALPVSSTEQQKEIPSTEHATCTESQTSSENKPNHPDSPSLSVQSGSPREPSQETQSLDKSSSVGNGPDQSSYDLASHKNGVEYTDDACEGDERYKEKNGKDGVKENIVCDVDTVQENPLPHSDSTCEESTSCASEKASATNPFVEADSNQPLTLESSVVPELSAGQNLSENFVDSSNAVISGVCGDVQAVYSGEKREESQGDVSVLGQKTDIDSNHQSQTGVHEMSRTAVAALCVQGTEGISVKGSCVQNSICTSATGVVVQDSCGQDTCNNFTAQIPNREYCVQELDSSLVSQGQNSKDCPQNTDLGASGVQESLSKSERRESVCDEVTSKEQQVCRSEQTLVQLGDHSNGVKSSGTSLEPRIAESAEETSTNTTPEDEGSSVDPVEYSQHLQKSDFGPKDPEESESSDNDFEDVTSTIVDAAVDKGCRTEEHKDLPQDQIVSYSDEASDDDDFFDAFDEDEQTGEALLSREDDVYRQSADGRSTSDLPAGSESQSGANRNTDHTSANEFFDCQKEETAIQDEENPSAHPKSPRQRRPRRKWITEKPHISLNLWSVLKNCIGKELSRIPMPVNFNEPLSMLQRLTEELEYSEILDKAALCEDSCQQMAHVAAFTVSAYATTQFRTAKPFNPLLGETFEFDRSDDLGWRTLAEQVSHHPPTLATHTEGRGWTLWQEFTMTIKFRGRYIQIIPMGMAHLKFSSSGHHYTWRKVTTTVHNIIVGRLWVDNEGLMDITNHATGDVCHLKYQAYSYFSRDPHRKVTGVVRDSRGVAHWTLSGTWCSQIEAAPILRTPTEEDEEGEEEEEGKEEEEEEEQTSTSCYAGLASSSKNKEEYFRTGPAQVLWKVRPPPDGADKIYYFSRLAIQMNEPEDDVAPTDSRRRPDQRKMEEGDWEEANRLKFLLEEKQRGARRRREAEAEAAKEQGLEAPEYQPVWFHKETDPVTGNSLHVYTGRYWQCKEGQQWDSCPDIFL